ncbi:hypothetical protein SPRG_03727 [Saprolegnia parasitica CBS 223.65]|uniref:subtilisin n=1 Tax=Saprolegnia parasitica (strain CBS 223.65) TaxID=695850 RepID=A0A067CYD1_SAPPC|nr:hypothetical protein SPRG_03727 [Saprolegnia parasitica CBS 223.65]KDO31807.1 hypothetical protein SPRG_03727 [Saprolegnia parasitica CBS 223.65]|eukprot:XP_012197687.1 hypothetical protein SPRG_03727 [Saprolegnia parasitica CBS 223.65]
MHATTTRRAFASHRWTLAADATDATALTWSMGLQAANPRHLDDAVADVSDPTRSTYGRYLNVEAANALVAPAPETLEAIHAWLGHRRTSYCAATNILTVFSSVGETRQLFGTEIATFQSDGRRILRASTEMQLPEHIHRHLSFVSLNSAPLSLAPLRATISKRASSYMTPLKLRKLYNVPASAHVTQATQGIPAFYAQNWSPSDLAAFENLHKLMPAPVLQRGNRRNNPLPEYATGEVSLDLQYITAMAPNATTTVWTMNSTNPFSTDDEPFVDWAADVLSDPRPPLVHSLSYADDEDHIMEVAKEYALHLDTLLQKMAVRGLTVLVASGDDGVAGQRIHAKKMSIDAGCATSGPQWPSSSPYVTSVGATQLDANGVEVVCSGALHGGITSGGGFSNVYPTPAYQKPAVAAYLSSHACPTKPGFFNPQGRAYPDIAVLGAHYSVIVNGKVKGISGTSASTPALAGLVTLWNDQRLRAGLPPLGFLNPLLYQIGSKHNAAFYDVVSGNNGAARNGTYSCPISFAAGPGWDAVSGWGTPRFDVLSTLVAAKTHRPRLTSDRSNYYTIALAGLGLAGAALRARAPPPQQQAQACTLGSSMLESLVEGKWCS